MKLVGWIVKYRSPPRFGRDAWRNSRRMSWTEARKLVALLRGTGYQTRLTEITVERWLRMPMSKKRCAA